MRPPDPATDQREGRDTDSRRSGSEHAQRVWARATSQPVHLLLVAFVASRLAYQAAGVTFDTFTLGFAWQLIDPELLEHDLLTSIWYSHTQPPLFNLFVGVVLRCSPFGDAATFGALYMAMGAALTILMYELGRRVGLSTRWAMAVTALFVVSPAAVLFENYLFYTYPMTVLVTLAAVLLHRFAERPGRRRYAAYVAALAAIVLTRQLFHPVWFLAAAGAPVLLAPRGARRRLLAVASVPLVLLVVWTVRAQVLYGTTQLTSWSSMNLARMMTLQIPEEDRARLVDDGTLSPFALEVAFQRYPGYEDLVPPCRPEHRGVAVLRDPLKSTGYPNFNYECYLPVYEAYGEDILPALRAQPSAYVRAVATAVQVHWQPSSLYSQVGDNRAHIDDVDRAYRRLVLLEVTAPAVVIPEPFEERLVSTGRSTRLKLSLTTVAGELAALTLGLTGALALRRGDRTARTVLRVFLGSTVLWVLVVGNAFELEENNRFRLMIDPMLLCALAVVARGAARRLRARR